LPATGEADSIAGCCLVNRLSPDFYSSDTYVKKPIPVQFQPKNSTKQYCLPVLTGEFRPTFDGVASATGGKSQQNSHRKSHSQSYFRCSSITTASPCRKKGDQIPIIPLQ
jgi:hypothetical protein